MFLLSENGTDAQPSPLDWAPHVMDICTFQQRFEKYLLRPQWLFQNFAACMVVSKKLPAHHEHRSQEPERQQEWIQQNNSLYEHFLGAGV